MSFPKLIKELKNVKPVVDNPAGFIHNYMARKPYNVVNLIIKELTNSSDVVCDPMFGSGTTIIESSKLNRSAVGIDINPLAYNLCKLSLSRWDLKEVNRLVDSFVLRCKESLIPYYSFTENGEVRIIERCHFDRNEDILVPTEYWFKTLKGDKLSGRKKAVATENLRNDYYQYTQGQVTIEDKPLLENLRIAIHDGYTLKTYFCSRNWVALDTIFSILEEYKDNDCYEILELLVSSAINLIKLSDKKANSQIPYWLPQKNITSRNAFFILEDKAQKIKEGLSYLKKTLKIKLGGQNGKNVILKNCPAQDVDNTVVPDNSVKLILTDPPYTDQVPYMEYNQLTIKLMSWDSSYESLLNKELVVSDAQSRNKDADSFYKLWDEIVQRYSHALCENGFFVMFFHSFDLRAWNNMINSLEKAGLKYLIQVPVPAPRKSFKTVMSPKSTLDGNYIVFFQKKQNREEQRVWSLEEAYNEALSTAKHILSAKTKATSQDLYDLGMLKDSIEKGYLQTLSTKYSTFIDVIKKVFIFENGYWRV